jgi:hypothetical protein
VPAGLWQRGAAGSVAEGLFFRRKPTTTPPNRHTRGELELCVVTSLAPARSAVQWHAHRTSAGPVMNTQQATAKSSVERKTSQQQRQARPPEKAKEPRVAETPDPVRQGLPLARLSQLGDTIVSRIRRRPLEALAAAIGVGFLVGGAMTFRAGRVALAIAARHAAREVLKQVL